MSDWPRGIRALRHPDMHQELGVLQYPGAAGEQEGMRLRQISMQVVT